MLLLLLLLPTIGGLVCFLLRWQWIWRLLILLIALAHTGLTLAAWHDRPAPILDGWLLLDSTGLVFLTITSTLFLAAVIYAVGYLHRESKQREHPDYLEGFFYPNEPEAVFTGCLLLFLASMTLVTLSQQFGILWVAVEATTLASAPLIYFHKHHRSLEATWKYLLICSVGIALALLGTYSLAAAAATEPGGESVPLLFGELIQQAGRLHPVTLKAAFLFFLVGYGTKMGLAPLHTWLPDAHSESPSLVSALLSGTLLNCAFLAILRVFQICAAAGQAAFAQELLIGSALLSMVVAAVFIIGQSDFKRMLGYSSVEHMGILAVGVGLGGVGYFGSLLHAVNHSLVKGALFLIAGNILAVYHTKEIRKVTGLGRGSPGPAPCGWPASSRSPVRLPLVPFSVN